MLLFIIAFNNCDKDFEASEKVENITASENSRFHVRTGNNVSKKAITFLKERTDNTLKVSLSNKSIVLSKSSFTARETAMGTVDTSKEIAVDNEYNTKHTFKVINDGDPNTVINVIVVETADVIYEYFKKYSFQNNLPLNPDNTVNLNLFTGIIETYNSLGELTGALQVINGEVVNSGGNNDPCPDNDGIWDGWDDFFNQLNNNTSSGNNGGTNTDDGSNTSNGNTQGGGEYTNPDDEEGCTVYEATTTCWCNNEAGYGYHSNHVNESTFLVVRCGNYVVTTAQRNSNLTSRNPEDENPCGDGDTGVLIDNIIHEDNCEELESNSVDTTFKLRLQALKNNINGTLEQGFGIYNGSYNDPPAANPACSPILSGTAQNGPEIPFHITIKALAHNHLKDSTYNHIGTFAPKDILQFNDMITLLQQQNSQVTNGELATYLICDEGNYALKVNNDEKLYNFALKYGTNNAFRKRIDNFYKDNKMVHAKAKHDQNIGFLKLIEKFDLGVNLYEADENFENWEQLKLNETSDDITKESC